MNFGMIIQNQNLKKNSKLCYIDTESFIFHVKTRYLESHCRRCWNKVWHFKLRKTIESERPLPKEKNKEVIG